MRGLERPVQLALLPRVGPVRRRAATRTLAGLIPLVPGILATARTRSDREPVDAAWRILRAELTETRVAVVTLGRSPREPTAVLKVACTEEAADGLRTEATALCALQADPRLADWCRFAPTVLAAGEHSGSEYVLQRFLRGRRASSLLDDPPARRRMLRAAAAAVSTLHEQTASTAVAGPRSLERWIGEPLRVVEALTAHGSSGRGRALERLGTELAASFRDRIVRVSWIHGDYWPGNLLVARGGSRVTGIVDWDQAAPGQPPQLDLLHLLLYTRALVRRCDLGTVVREVVASGDLPAYERELLDGLDPVLPGNGGQVRALTLLYWLRHVSGNLVQSSAYARNRLWLRRNVDAVLRSL